jgi:hypothetical protein
MEQVVVLVECCITHHFCFLLERILLLLLQVEHEI